MTFPTDYINQVIQGDCLEIMKGIPDKSIDLVLTDPPYAGAGMKYDTYDDTNIELTNKLIRDFVNTAIRIGKISIFPSGKYATEKMLYKECPPQWRMCWYKGACGGISPIGFNDWEMIMVYGEKICVNQHDFFRVQGQKLGEYGHPCPKPLGWAKWIIHRFSKPNDLILDPFLGSGTTAVAAKELGRRFIGIEISEKYCDLARKRLQYTEKPLLLTTKPTKGGGYE